MRNVSDKRCGELQYTLLFLRKSCTFYELMWKTYSRAGQATDDNIIRRVRLACGVTKAADTLSEYLTLIACPRQLLLREPRLNITFYVHCLSVYCNNCQSCGKIRVLKVG